MVEKKPLMVKYFGNAALISVAMPGLAWFFFNLPNFRGFLEVPFNLEP
jgi:hypothetical protein